VFSPQQIIWKTLPKFNFDIQLANLAALGQKKRPALHA